MSKKVLIALPPTLLTQVDFMANAESRTRSDLIREAIRRYLENFKRTYLLGTNSQTITMLEETLAKTTTNQD